MAKGSDMNEVIKTEEGDDPFMGIRMDSYLFCYCE